MDPLVPLIIGPTVGGMFGAGGVLAWLRFRTVEAPVSKASIEKTRAETEKIHAEARSVEVDALLEALKQVSDQRTEAYQRIDTLNQRVTTLSSDLNDVRDQLAEWRRWARELRATPEFASVPPPPGS